MKVSALVLSAMLSFTLNAEAQSKHQQDERQKPKSETPQDPKKTKKSEVSLKRANPDSTKTVRPRKEMPDNCPACGRG